MTLSISKATVAGILFTGFASVAEAAPATVTADLNLREGPGTYHTAVATIPFGDTVDVVSCEGAWCEIDWRGFGGFASRSYLAYGYQGRSARYPSAPLVVLPPPAPPAGPVVYSVPYYDPPAIYRSSSVGLFVGF